MNKILAAAVILCAGSAYAADVPQIDWNKDPVAQTQGYLQAAQAEDMSFGAVEVRMATPEQTSPTPIPMEALARSVNVLSYNDGYDVDRSVELTLNNDKDRVGAELSVCEPAGSPDNPPACDYVEYAFPQLTVSGDRILLGAETVATIRHSFLGGTSIKLEPAFKLSFDRQTILVDTGFDRVKKDKYTVSLERK